MRKDEEGNECPETLGEYRDLCHAIAPDSKAVEFLDQKIEEDSEGRNAIVIASDLNMRTLLMPMLAEPVLTPHEYKEGETSKAICPECKKLVPTTLRTRDHTLNEMTKAVLVSVCDECNTTVGIPHSSAKAFH